MPRGNRVDWRSEHGSDGDPILRQCRWKDHIKTMLRRRLKGERVACVATLFARDKEFWARVTRCLLSATAC